MSDETVDALHDHDQHVQPDREREDAALAFLRRVMVMVAAMAVIVADLVVVIMRMLVMVVRVRVHLLVVRSEIALRLGDVFEQFTDHRADVAVGGEIEDLLALPFGPHDARGPQQAQMMAHE
jgi:hypothetical protein